MDKKKFAEGTLPLTKTMTTMNSNQKEASPSMTTNNSKLSMLMMSYQNIIPKMTGNLKTWEIGFAS